MNSIKRRLAAVGIDLGTSTSLIALKWIDEILCNPDLIADKEGAIKTPSIIGKEHGEFVHGQCLKSKYYNNSTDYVRFSKCTIGR